MAEHKKSKRKTLCTMHLALRTMHYALKDAECEKPEAGKNPFIFLFNISIYYFLFKYLYLSS